MTTYADVEAFRKGNLLPRGLLHASIATKVWVEFLRGDYDTAVFQALKEVEVAVRNAASLPNDVVGIALMRRAFDAERGPLTDTSAVEAERESRAHLFAGAIGCYKNPPSHRPVDMGAEEAVEVIMLASHLLRVVEAAVARKTATPP